MPLISEMVHKNSMDFRNQRKCYLLAEKGDLTWDEIAGRLHTLRGPGHHPSVSQCQRVHKSFNVKLGRRVYNYKRCGRKRWKVTPEIEHFIVRKLLSLRTKCICTSTTLQRELQREMGVVLECSTIRKILKR